MTKTIGLDLDGIIIGRPPGVPKSLIEYLYKDHKSNKLTYRFPSPFEQKIRRLTHLPGVRPPLSDNCRIIRDLSKKGYPLYIISGRFGFLEDLTFAWLKRQKMEDIFRKIYLNKENLQPHLFKEKILKNLKIDLYIDDDFETIAYLASRFQKIHFYWHTEDKNTKLNVNNVTAINDLSKILS